MGSYRIAGRARPPPCARAPKGIRGACRRLPGWQRTSIRDRSRARVGNRVQVWRGERLAFHTHVLDYFWTSVTGGHGRSHFSDGRVSDTAYKPGDIKQLTFKEGEFMVHDPENIGDTELLFTTVEFLDSPKCTARAARPYEVSSRGLKLPQPTARADVPPRANGSAEKV
jgi:hypothetical protein